MAHLLVVRGTGNTALLARACGAVVMGVQVTPGLLDVARRRGAAEGHGEIV